MGREELQGDRLPCAKGKGKGKRGDRKPRAKGKGKGEIGSLVRKERRKGKGECRGSIRDNAWKEDGEESKEGGVVGGGRPDRRRRRGLASVLSPGGLIGASLASLVGGGLVSGLGERKPRRRDPREEPGRGFGHS